MGIAQKITQKGLSKIQRRKWKYTKSSYVRNEKVKGVEGPECLEKYSKCKNKTHIWSKTKWQELWEKTT